MALQNPLKMTIWTATTYG